MLKALKRFAKRVCTVVAFAALLLSAYLFFTGLNGKLDAMAAQSELSQAQANVFIVTIPTNTHTGGTGFLINGPDGKVVVTNRHVCGISDDGVVLLQQGERSYISQIIVRSRLTDLCLIKAPVEVKALSEGYSLSTIRMVRGEPVTVYGHPWLSPLKKSLGSYTNTNIEWFNPDDPMDQQTGVRIRVGRLTVHISPGNSGSPVLNRNRQVVGVIFAFEVQTGQGLMIPAADLERVLNEASYQ